MGCGGSKEAADEPKVQHIPATSLNALLPKGHERLGSLLLTLEHQAAADTQKWLQMIDEERSARKAIESASGKSFDEFRAWVAIVEESLSEGIVSLAQLEEAWQVQGSAAKAAAVKAEAIRARAAGVRAPLPHDHEEHAGLLAALRGGAEPTAAFLQLVDETRARRKSVEAASGLAYAHIRAWVHLVQEELVAAVPGVELESDSWQPLPQGHAELGELLDALRAVGATGAGAGAEEDEAHEGGAALDDLLRRIEETSARQHALEKATGGSLAEYSQWARMVAGAVAKELVSLADLEAIWKVEGSAPQPSGWKAEMHTLNEVQANNLTEAPAPPLPKGHAELGSLISVLTLKDAEATRKWLQEVDETRSRRKAIEALTGAPLSDFGEWVRLVEDLIQKDMEGIGHLERVWAVGSHAKDADRI